MSLNFKKIYLEWPLFKIIFVITFLFSVIITFIPLLNTIGYESSLITSLFLSLSTGLLTISYLQRIRDQLAPFPGAKWTIYKIFLKIAKLVILLFFYLCSLFLSSVLLRDFVT